MRLAKCLLKMNIQRETIYRLNFILLCISVAPIHLIQMVFSWFIAKRFSSFDGWNGWELIFLYGLMLTSYSIAQVFFRRFRYLEEMVINGGIDIYFVKPQSILFSLVFYNLSTMELFSQLLPSFIVMLLSCFLCGIKWNLLKIIVFIGAIAGGFIIQSAIFCLIGCVSFWTMKSSELENIFYSFKEFLNYPLHAYGKIILNFLTFIFPLAFINYYPSLFILDKSDRFSILEFLTLPVGILSAFIVGVIWRKALNHYNSSGN